MSPIPTATQILAAPITRRMSDDGGAPGISDAQLADFVRRISSGREPETPPSHTIPKLTGESVQTFISRYLFQVVLLAFAHPGPGLWHAHDEIGAILDSNSFKLVGRLVIVEEHEEAAKRYQIAQCPTYIAFRQAREFKRFHYSELEELKAFLNEQIAARTGRSIGDAPALPPSPAPPSPPKAAPPEAKPPPRPPKAAPPEAKPPPSPPKAAPTDAKPPTSTQKATPTRVQAAPGPRKAAAAPPKPAAASPRKAATPEVPWVEFRKKPTPGFKLTPAQEATKQLGLVDEMNEADLDLAFEATGSDDLAEIVDWIAEFQEDSELWAETDWIMAGRPAATKPPPAPAPIPAPAPKPAAKPAPRPPPKPAPDPAVRAAPRGATIRFLIGGKTAEHSFEATATIADLAAKLRERDVPGDANLSFAEPPAGRPIGPDDYEKTLAELKIVGRVRLVVTVLEDA